MSTLIEELVNAGSQVTGVLNKIPNIPGLNIPGVAKSRKIIGKAERIFNRGIRALKGVEEVFKTPQLGGSTEAGTIEEQWASAVKVTANDGFAKPTRYFVDFKEIPFRTSSNNDKFLMGIRCAEASFGQVAVNTIEHRHFGSVAKIANNLNYNDFRLAFYCSENHNELDFFHEWIDLVVNKTDFHAGYYNDYIGQIDVYQLDGSRNPLCMDYFEQKVSFKQEFTNCYPTSITEIPLSYASLNSIERCVVNFTWR